GNGNNQFIFSNGVDLKTGIINGGGGPNNLLDYEAEASGVRVNFDPVKPFTNADLVTRGAITTTVPAFVVPPHSATGTGGVFGVQNAIGSDAGGNILAGGPGNNRLEAT